MHQLVISVRTVEADLIAISEICSSKGKMFRQFFENSLAANVLRNTIASKYFLFGRKIEISLVIGN
jgi:hypothetical protein